MNPATVTLLVMACALVDCATSAEDARQFVGKRRNPCVESATAASECLQEIASAGTDVDALATFCSKCKQVLQNYYQTCGVSGPATTGNLERLCPANADGNSNRNSTKADGNSDATP